MHLCFFLIAHNVLQLPEGWIKPIKLITMKIENTNTDVSNEIDKPAFLVGAVRGSTVSFTRD